jgi:hypothetical protein
VSPLPQLRREHDACPFRTEHSTHHGDQRDVNSQVISRSTLQPRSEKLPIITSLPGIARIQEKSRTTPPRHWPTNPILSLDSRSPCWRSLHRTSHLHLRYRRHL